MVKAGTLKSWNDGKGYGFITPEDGGKDVFVHVRALPQGTVPRPGTRLNYRLGKDSRGRVCALEVFAARGALSAAVRGLPSGRDTGLALLYVLLIVIAGSAAWVPRSFLWAVLLLSAVAFAVYGMDKMSARQGSWRTRETTLHLLALAGGWPGALLAQKVFRHKTRKPSFQRVFWVTVLLNLLLFLSLFTEAGTAAWQRFLAQAF